MHIRQNTPLHLPGSTQWWSYLRAVAIAGLLNLFLFALMPALIGRELAAPRLEEITSQVQVVRMPKRTRPKPPDPVQPKKPQLPPKPTQQPTLNRPLKLSLPFAINPKLPGKPTDLQLPPPNTSVQFDPLGGESFGEADLDSPLTILARTPPFYPLRARQRGIEGWVKVQLLVDEQGQVTRSTILQSHPQGVFEQSVQRCVANWRFQPGTVEGVAVKAWVETTITFELE